MTGMEIERKWLIRPENIPYDLNTLPHRSIEQCYLCFNPVIRIRQYNCGETCRLTLKTDGENGGLSRSETEIPIANETYTLLRPKLEGVPIRKTRYVYARPDGLKEEIDIFEGSLQGLAYLEIEFPDEASARAFPDPAWITRDVTCIPEYKNSSLAEFGLPKNAMK